MRQKCRGFVQTKEEVHLENGESARTLHIYAGRRRAERTRVEEHTRVREQGAIIPVYVPVVL